MLLPLSLDVYISSVYVQFVCLVPSLAFALSFVSADVKKVLLFCHVFVFFALYFFC